FARLVGQVVARPAGAVAPRISALDDPVLRLPEQQAVVVAVGGEDNEVVHGDWCDLGMELHHDVALRGGYGRGQLLRSRDAHRLRCDELVWTGLGRGLAA